MEPNAQYQYDHLGTPLALSDKDGVVVAEWKRDPFGMVVSKTGSVNDNNMFPGQVWDSDAGLAYNWNRWYSPEIGRYVQNDPLASSGLVTFALAQYKYASLNPLSRIDPTGLLDCPKVILQTGVARGGNKLRRIDTGNVISGGPTKDCPFGTWISIYEEETYRDLYDQVQYMKEDKTCCKCVKDGEPKWEANGDWEHVNTMERQSSWCQEGPIYVH